MIISKVLTILSSPNLCGGTPKKTLDIVKRSRHKHTVYFYSKSSRPEKTAEYFEEFSNYCLCVDGTQYGRNILKHLWELLKVVDNDHIEVVQAYFAFGGCLGAMLKIMRPKLKLVVSFVTVISQSNRLKRAIEGLLLSTVDVAVFITKAVRTSKNSEFTSLCKKRGELIYNGSPKRDDNGTFSNKFNGFSLVYIAGFPACKNQELLVRAMEIISKEENGKDVYCHFIGQGPEEARLKGLVEEKGLSDNIVFWGYQEDVGSALNNAKLYVHPCYAEGFGIAVVEAMLAGLPVVVADQGGLPELVEGAECGYIVPFDDAERWAEIIMRIKQDEHERYRLGMNARKRAEEMFSIDTFVQKHDELYSELAEKRGSI